MEYYSAIKRNETGSFVEMWMDLETVIQSEVSQKEKNKYHILTHTCRIQKNDTMNLFTKQKQTHRHRKQTWLQKGKGGGRDKLEIWE